ncbi:MAG: UbiD family decarboxylase [Elusimicrobia bacterium]|nr:UbiD family decarboxylase [Elusimicrobiota bacterium]
MNMDIRSQLSRLRRSGKLRVVGSKTIRRFEAGKLISAAEPLPILLKDVEGAAVAGNLFPSRAALAAALRVSPDRFLLELDDLLAGRARRPGAGLTRRDQVYGDFEIPLSRIRQVPFLTYYASDRGPYLTAGVWVVRDPVHGVNLSYHRLMMTSPTRGTVRVVENRGMDTAIKHANGKAEVAICVGAPAHVLFAAALSPAMGVNEFGLAARFDRVDLVRCKTVDLEVPADCECVIEGRFTGKLKAEGPFVDITGTIDGVRSQPEFEITRVSGKKDPIHYTIVPGLADHKTLMGVPKELDIFREVSKVCRCLDIRITPGGASWLHAVVKIEKKNADDGGRAIRAAFQGHRSLKACVVVDSDIDLDRPEQVEWSLATRFQASKGLVVLHGQPGSSLDPSALHRPGKKTLGSKMGLDATIPCGVPRRLFERLAVMDRRPRRRGAFSARRRGLA